jgi:hypothetical protein
MFAVMQEGLQQVQAGKVRTTAVTGAKRNPAPECARSSDPLALFVAHFLCLMRISALLDLA